MAVILVDHELFQGVQVRWYQRADGLVIVVQDLLPLALRAHRAGGPDQAGVWSAVALGETALTSQFHVCERGAETLDSIPATEISRMYKKKGMRIWCDIRQEVLFV